MINCMSAICSGLTILFLFWSITHLARKLIVKEGEEMTMGQMFAILGASLIGSLTYTFTDTFWFSAVEGEVYAMSSLFTAVVFWAILKWENVAFERYANRWLILMMDIDNDNKLDSQDLYYLLLYIAMHGAGIKATWSDVLKN